MPPTEPPGHVTSPASLFDNSITKIMEKKSVHMVSDDDDDFIYTIKGTKMILNKNELEVTK